MVKLAQRMTRDFCAGVCATMHVWQLVQAGNVGEEARLIIRNSVDKPGEPSGIVLSATTSVWMPITHQRLFDFLRDEQLRSEWDELSHGGPMQEMVHVAKGQDRANCVSLLRATVSSYPLLTEWVCGLFGIVLVFHFTETKEVCSLVTVIHFVIVFRNNSPTYFVMIPGKWK